MAEQELPLVPLFDVWAQMASQRAGNKVGYSTSFQIGHGEESHRRADQRQMDAFLRGKNGDKIIRLVAYECPPDWVQPTVDPNQGEEDADTTAHWQEDFARIIDHMTDADSQT